MKSRRTRYTKAGNYEEKRAAGPRRPFRKPPRKPGPPAPPVKSATNKPVQPSRPTKSKNK